MFVKSNIFNADKINFQTWQDADCHAVTNVFSFYNMNRNSYLVDTVVNTLNIRSVEQNEFLHGSTFNFNSQLDFLNSIVDNYLDTKLIMHDPQSIRGIASTQLVDRCVEAHQIMLYFASYAAISLYEDLKQDSNFNTYINIAMSPEMIAKTVARKQKDYGSSNISKFGIWGLVLRMHDKIGRLENLISKKKTNAVKDETIFDTLVDLVGYCVVAYLWINNWFMIPMHEAYQWDDKVFDL
ncbi:MAG: Nucleotide modification associated domain 1 [Bacteroidota bacterium]|jgi:hypothetical protein